jgi:hypothetical protein
VNGESTFHETATRGGMTRYLHIKSRRCGHKRSIEILVCMCRSKDYSAYLTQSGDCKFSRRGFRSWIGVPGMSRIYSGCAPRRAEPIPAGFHASCAYVPWPVDAGSATGFRASPSGAYFTLQDIGRLQWLTPDRVTKETPDATMLRSGHSLDDRQAQSDDRLHLETIALGSGNSSVSRFAAAVKCGRIEQLILPPSDRHTRGLRPWQ